jgi:hypothetical protein
MMSAVEKIEEQLPAVEQPKPKQYLLMVDDVFMAVLGRIVPGMRFVEVEGMSLEGNNQSMVLATPIPKPKQ